MQNGFYNPWLQIWTSPKKTMRSILERNPQSVIIWLAVCSGILSAFSWIGYLWNSYPARADIRNGWLFFALLIGGGILGILYLYIGGWLYKITGFWLGGKGTFSQIKCATGWSNYPLILANIASCLSVWSASHTYLQVGFGLLNGILAIWGFIIFLNMLGEAHHFSAWRAFLAVLIALFLIFVTLMIVLLLVPLLAPLFD